VALAAAGCRGAGDPYPVQGTVYLDGQPATELAGGTVTFNSAELQKSASGEIQADGTYRLGTVRKGDGAVPGKYQVTVSPPEARAKGERGGGAPAPEPAAFEGPEEPEVTVERRANDIPVRLRRRR
jgi:hypothetical protein